MFQGGVTMMIGATQEVIVDLGRIAHRQVEVKWVEAEVGAVVGLDRGVNHQKSLIQDSDEWDGRNHFDDLENEISVKGRHLRKRRWKMWRQWWVEWKEIVVWISKELVVKGHTADRLALPSLAQLTADQEKVVVLV